MGAVALIVDAQEFEGGSALDSASFPTDAFVVKAGEESTMVAGFKPFATLWLIVNVASFVLLTVNDVPCLLVPCATIGDVTDLAATGTPGEGIGAVTAAFDKTVLLSGVRALAGAFLLA